jgi:WXG100 family type VII secretion target
MSGGTNSVDIEGMRQAHGQLDDAHSQLGQHLSTMSGQRDVLAGGWSGAASNTFLGNYEDWLSEMGNVHGALGSLRDVLATNTGVYGNTDDETIAAARQAGPGNAPGLQL